MTVAASLLISVLRSFRTLLSKTSFATGSALERRRDI
jgi:hypothetical protein